MNSLYKRKSFDIVDGGIACLIFIALQYVMYFVIATLPKGSLNNSVVYTIFSVVLELLFVAASYSIVIFRKTDFLKATTLNKKPSKKIVLYGLIVAVVCLLLFTDLTSAFAGLLEKFGYKSNSSAFVIDNFGSYALSIITVCVLPAFCEELLFRGVVLNSLKPLGKWAAIIISGFAFMIMHGNPDQTIHQLILGIVFGYIVYETRNIWCTIAIHFFNNFIAITMQYILSGVQTNTTTSPSAVTWEQIGGSLIIGIIFAIIGISAIKYATKWLKKPATNKLNAIIVDSGADDPLQPITNTPESASQTIAANAETADIKAEVDNITAENADSENIKEETPKPTKTQKIICALCYTGFIAYFVYEWVIALINGL